MKTLIKTTILSLFIMFLFPREIMAQNSTSGGKNAESEMKMEQNREKDRRSRENKAEKKAEKTSTTPQHKWILSRKRTKNAKQTDKEKDKEVKH